MRIPPPINLSPPLGLSGGQADAYWLAIVIRKAHSEKSPGKSNNGHQVAESGRLPPATMRREPMTTRNPQIDIYDPKMLEGMDQAFAAIWAIVRGPVRNSENDCELRIAVGRKLLNLVAEGVTDPIRLRQLTVKSLFLPGH
jgi:hypothetical protein